MSRGGESEEAGFTGAWAASGKTFAGLSLHIKHAGRGYLVRRYQDGRRVGRDVIARPVGNSLVGHAPAGDEAGMLVFELQDGAAKLALHMTDTEKPIVFVRDAAG